jgi:hypothetical protein
MSLMRAEFPISGAQVQATTNEVTCDFPGMAGGCIWRR